MTDDGRIDGETKRRLQITALTEMFAGLGSEATPDRIAYYLRLVGDMPPFLLRAACDAAVIETDTGFPPGPGSIIRHAKRLKAQRRIEERERAKELQRETERAEIARQVADRASEPVVSDLLQRVAMPKPPQPDIRARDRQIRKLLREHEADGSTGN